MKRIENLLQMRALAVMAVAGCVLSVASPAQACSGPLQPKFMGGLAPNLAVQAKLAAMAKVGMGGAVGAEMKNGASAEQAKTTPSIVGLWQTSYLSNSQVIDEGFEAWHSDGTEILIDIAPPATDNVCIGTWVQTGTLTYSLTHPSWTFDMNGNLTGTAMILNSITLSHDGDHFTGSYTINTFDVDGKPNGHLEGQLSAVRVPAQ